MFSKIVNPKSNKKVNINSKMGKEILNNYVNNQSGGRVEWNHHRFNAGGQGATRQRSRAEIKVLNMLRVEYRGGNGAVQNYAAFWRNPNRRYRQFGYWNNRDRFISMSLNEFISDMGYPSDQQISDFINIIKLRFLDSRQHAIDDGETIVFRNHNDIIIGMLEAFWNLTERRPDKRLRLNRINFLEISPEASYYRDEYNQLHAVHWEEISVGLTSSVMNYQLPDPQEGEAHDAYEQYREDELQEAFEQGEQH